MVLVNSIANTADPISDAVLSPQGSLTVRQMLQAALANSPSASASASWVPQAQALLANVLMNDVLNQWNDAGQAEIAAAEVLASKAGNIPPAHHAQGLIYRARREHKLARQAFKRARDGDPGSARAHAQFGNQKTLLGREQEAHAPLDRARSLSPNHPASGYFYWGEGRAYFQEERWSNAINWLRMSSRRCRRFGTTAVIWRPHNMPLGMPMLLKRPRKTSKTNLARPH